MKKYTKIAFKLIVLSLVAVPMLSFAAFDKNLSSGSSGSSVTELQQFLKSQGLYTGTVTGKFLASTKTAVIAFQNKYGITPASGNFGSLSRAQAKKLISSSSINSASSISKNTNNVVKVKPIDPAIKKQKALNDRKAVMDKIEEGIKASKKAQ